MKKRYYTPPVVRDFGSVAEITGLTGHVSEQDTVIDRNGNVSHLPGPESQLFCQDDSPHDGVCDYQQ